MKPGSLLMKVNLILLKCSKSYVIIYQTARAPPSKPFIRNALQNEGPAHNHLQPLYSGRYLLLLCRPPCLIPPPLLFYNNKNCSVVLLGEKEANGRVPVSGHRWPCNCFIKQQNMDTLVIYQPRRARVLSPSQMFTDGYRHFGNILCTSKVSELRPSSDPSSNTVDVCPHCVGAPQ